MFNKLNDRMYRTIAFGSTQHQYCLITVPQILNNVYLKIVYFRTEKFNQIYVNIVLGFSPTYIYKEQQHYYPISNKQKNCTQIVIQHMIHLPQYNPKRDKFYLFTIYLFCIVLFHRLILHLYTNLSRFYSRNPRTPANHSVAAE